MTTQSVPAGDDPRRLLADARALARRVRLTQRVTWLPLLVLALVMFGAIPAHRYGREVISGCEPQDIGQVCKVWYETVTYYWLTALALAYVVIVGGYLRVARARGVDARVWPYAIAGIALVGLGFAFAEMWIRLDALTYPEEPSAFLQFVFRLLDPPGAIGLALLVLAWLERHVALLLFAVVYLTVVAVPINFGWGAHWGPRTWFVPQLVINGCVLLLGAIGFAVAGRRHR
jgi:hypothetical protein